ncbi:unnamed protein product [Dracunculus medinensis]|uniref:BTB domain-containing protein n=1 Tax=Dracunculus medinensis TaxID=318479 RepID=A0A0N4US41_DRAME|nr:unnamed protein product [Dracunculus medinensis]
MSMNDELLTITCLKPSDFNCVMKYLMENFITEEPLCVAVDFTEEDAWNMTSGIDLCTIKLMITSMF